MSANSESSLDLLSQPEWVKFLRHFELGEGFALIVLLVGDSSLARLCQRDLDLWLCARQRPRLFSLSIESPEDLEKVPGELLRMVPPTGPVWISGSGARELYERAWERCAVKLNRIRNTVAADYSTPLVLVGPPWVREILRDTAPDLWSIRAFVAEIFLPRLRGLTLPFSHPTPSEFPLDPDLTLRQIAELRRLPGRERQLRALLVRAGDELARHGRLKEALSVIEEALKLDETAVSHYPDRAEYLRDLSVSYDRMGTLMTSFGSRDEARRFHEKAHNIAERLVHEHPDRVDDSIRLSTSYERLGDLMTAFGSGDEARHFQGRALQIREQIARQDPGRADLLRELSVSYDRMGSLMTSLGSADDARNFHQKALEIAERLAHQYPNSATYLRSVAVAFNRLGDLEQDVGSEDEARELYRKAVAICELLVGQDPNRADYQWDLVVSLWRIGTSDALKRAVNILKSMMTEDKLTSEQSSWIPEIEAALLKTNEQSN